MGSIFHHLEENFFFFLDMNGHPHTYTQTHVVLASLPPVFLLASACLSACLPDRLSVSIWCASAAAVAAVAVAAAAAVVLLVASLFFPQIVSLRTMLLLYSFFLHSFASLRLICLFSLLAVTQVCPTTN